MSGQISPKLSAISVEVTMESQRGAESRQVDKVTRQVAVTPSTSWEDAIKSICGDAMDAAIKLKGS